MPSRHRSWHPRLGEDLLLLIVLLNAGARIDRPKGTAPTAAAIAGATSVSAH